MSDPARTIRLLLGTGAVLGLLLTLAIERMRTRRSEAANR